MLLTEPVTAARLYHRSRCWISSSVKRGSGRGSCGIEHPEDGCLFGLLRNGSLLPLSLEFLERFQRFIENPLVGSGKAMEKGEEFGVESIRQ